MNRIQVFCLLIALCIGCFQLLSCEKVNKESLPFEGEMLRMECFGRWGIKTYSKESVDSIFYVIPDKLASNFEKEGLQVQFSAVLRPNELPLVFPDPSISMGSVFQGDVTNLSEK
jgi:hypothetical protein